MARGTRIRTDVRRGRNQRRLSQRGRTAAPANEAGAVVDEDAIVEAMLAAQRSGVPLSTIRDSGVFAVKMVEINNAINRSDMVRAPVQIDIQKRTGATVTTKGRYYPPGTARYFF